MEDAGKAIDGTKPSDAPAQADSTKETNYDAERRQTSDKKRKGDWPSDRQQYGSRGGASSRGGHGDSKRHKKGDLGRGEYLYVPISPNQRTWLTDRSRDGPDKRQRTTDAQKKREAAGPPPASGNYGVAYSKEEIDKEERRPKRKVAVLIGYSGTGYKGMQITPTEKTIEGDIFAAFIKAGAISKANADDPKKAGLVRCARTDKGVHAAGNMISLKLIVEDDDIVEKINAELSPQIRIWGIERTIGSFSCYQSCDSRWYEYLIPSHAFLPPHPSSFLAKELERLADEAGDREGYEGRQKEVRGFWEEVDAGPIKAILEGIDEDIRFDVVRALQGEDEAGAKTVKADADIGKAVKVGGGSGWKSEEDRLAALEKMSGNEKVKEGEVGEGEVGKGEDGKTEEAVIIIQPEPTEPKQADGGAAASAASEDPASAVDATVDSAASQPTQQPVSDSAATVDESTTLPTDPHPRAEIPTLPTADQDRAARLRLATRQLRQAYTTAKRRYRIPAARIQRVQAALSKFVGTSNYHNYTVAKTFRDPSAKRHIKSFVVEKTPILIGEGKDEEKSEWLSLKVHGQSFMMHQIRKMVGMVALLVRSGSSLRTLEASLGEERFSIPKVPGLGLLLERPVFDSYNNLQAEKHGREKLLFSKFEKDIAAFKEREIYQRIFREEEESNQFGRFFNHIDNFREGYFLWVSSKGIEACKDAGGSANGGKGKAGKYEESEDEGAGEDN